MAWVDETVAYSAVHQVENLADWLVVQRVLRKADQSAAWKVVSLGVDEAVNWDELKVVWKESLMALITVDL